MQIKQILIAIDQLANALLGGWSDETISSRCWRMRNASRFWQKMLSGIDWLFGAGHCEASYLAERRRSQLPPELREI